tara:strand:- start:85 stop:531 length:447 start_codon:yes stop_codon:yes gene_type:complete
MNENFLFGFYISLGVVGGIVLLSLIVHLIGQYKEKFNRNFFFTGSSWGLLIGQGLLIGGIISGVNEPEANFLDFLTFSSVLSSGAGTWVFYWGLIILLWAWIVNIRASSFWWGMFQNIVQGAVVVGLSIIIVLGALGAKEKIKQKTGL